MLATFLIPLVAEETRTPEQPVHAGRVLAGPKRQQVAEGLIRPAVIVGMKRGVASPQFLESVAVLRRACTLDQSLIVAAEACRGHGAVEVRGTLPRPQPKAQGIKSGLPVLDLSGSVRHPLPGDSEETITVVDLGFLESRYGLGLAADAVRLAPGDEHLHAAPAGRDFGVGVQLVNDLACARDDVPGVVDAPVQVDPGERAVGNEDVANPRVPARLPRRDRLMRTKPRLPDQSNLRARHPAR